MQGGKGKPGQVERSDMVKLDLKKEQKQLYAPSARDAAIVDVPPMLFLMIDGAGDPNTAPAYREAVEALFSVSYTLKFWIKKGDPVRDFVVMPLEGLWWADDPAEFAMPDKSGWKWTSLIRQPDFVTQEMVTAACEAASEKRELPALPLLKLETFHEGLSAQIMHIGPYAAEGPTVERLHRVIREKGYTPAGKHHEIYLSDPVKTAPEKIKTVLRQPMQKG
jgi:hypothetical protein